MTKDHLCFTNYGWLTLANIVKDKTTKIFVDDDIICTAIKDVTYVGESQTYDLSVVGPYHNFVANGFVVHNSVSEVSARYSVVSNDYYIPQHLYTQSSANKQCSSNDVIQNEENSLKLMRYTSESALIAYNTLLEAGTSRELARIILPLNIYTEWYWKIDLHNLLHFLRLRLAADAQAEIRVYANYILDILHDWVPLTYDAFINYRVNAVSISSKGIDALKNAVNVDHISSEDMSVRELRELQNIFN